MRKGDAVGGLWTWQSFIFANYIHFTISKLHPIESWPISNYRLGTYTWTAVSGKFCIQIIYQMPRMLKFGVSVHCGSAKRR